MTIKPLTVTDVLQTGYQKFIVEGRLPSCTENYSLYRLRVDGLEYRDLLGWCLPVALLNQLDIDALTKYNKEFDDHVAWFEVNGYPEDRSDYAFRKTLESYYPEVHELVAEFPQYFDSEVVAAEATGATKANYAFQLDNTLSAINYYLHDSVSIMDVRGAWPRWTISREELKKRYETAFTLAGLQLPGSGSSDDTAPA